MADQNPSSTDLIDIAQQPKPSKQRAFPADYGANNKLVTRERAEELRKILKAKLSNLNIRRAE
ncbi:MAG: hypothetical protein WD852_05880 [Methyloceanibacter sp.]